MDDRASLPPIPQRLVIFDRVVADRDDDIGRIQQAVARLVVEKPDPAGKEMHELPRHDPAGLEGDRHRQRHGRKELARRGSRPRLVRQHAEKDHRRLGLVDVARRLGDGLRRRSAGARGAHGREDARARRLVHHIAGQGDEGSAGARALRGPEGVRHDLADGRLGIDLDAVLADAAEQNRRVQALMRLLQPVRSGHHAAEAHHRRALRGRGGEAGHQIRRPGTGGDQADARLAGDPAQALGDEGGVLLMAADDGLDSRIEQGVKHPVDLGTGHPEYAGDALCLQIADQYFRTAGFSHRTSPSPLRCRKIGLVGEQTSVATAAGRRKAVARRIRRLSKGARPCYFRQARKSPK
jgi:hypothetical protein